MKKDIFTKLLQFLNDLDDGSISYSLHHYRENAVMIAVAVPGERWEIEFLDDGSIEVERFISDGEIFGENALGELLTKYSDSEKWIKYTNTNIE
jgi:hypothetical protein